MKIDGTEVMENAAWASVAYSAAKKIIARKYRAKSFLSEELLKDIVAQVGEPWDKRTMGTVIRGLRWPHRPVRCCGSQEQQW